MLFDFIELFKAKEKLQLSLQHISLSDYEDTEEYCYRDEVCNNNCLGSCSGTCDDTCDYGCEGCGSTK